MRVWIKLRAKGKPAVYLKMQFDGFQMCADGSVSNWLDTEFLLKGWKITAIGVMADYITVDVEGA